MHLNKKKQMHIIIDVTRLVRRTMKGQTLTGIDRVSMAYVQHYHTCAQALVRWCGRSVILSLTQSKALFSWLSTPSPNKWAARWMIIQGAWFNKRTRPNANTLLLNTGHIGQDPSDYLRMVRNHGIQLIFFVHDLIPMAYPEYCSAGEDIRHREKINYILTHAAGVIVNSNATRHDLVQYAAQTSQHMPAVEIALLAPGFKPALPGARPLNKPYFVMLGTIEPRKIHALLLQVWRRLILHYGEKTPHLVLIGQRGWECENVIDLLDRSLLLRGFFTEISHCKDADLVTYLHHSQALLFPSFIEGYGLPLIEALTLGVPVLASDLPVFREIAGDVVEYIDPVDGLRWGDCIMEYAKPTSRRRADQCLRIQPFTQPTWREHFITVDAFLERRIDLPHGPP